MVFNNFISYLSKLFTESYYGVKLINKNIRIIVSEHHDTQLSDLASKIIQVTELAKKYDICVTDIIRPIFFCFKFANDDARLTTSDVAMGTEQCCLDINNLSEYELAVVSKYISYLVCDNVDHWMSVKAVLDGHKASIGDSFNSSLFNEFKTMAVDKIKSVLSIHTLTSCIDDFAHIKGSLLFKNLRFITEVDVRVFCVLAGQVVMFSDRVNFKKLVKLLHGKAFVLFDMIWMSNKNIYSDYAVLINDKETVRHLGKSLPFSMIKMKMRQLKNIKCLRFIFFNRYGSASCSLLNSHSPNNSLYNVFFVKRSVTLDSNKGDGAEKLRLAIVQMLAKNDIAYIKFNTKNECNVDRLENIALKTPFDYDISIEQSGGHGYLLTRNGLSCSFQLRLLDVVTSNSNEIAVRNMDLFERFNDVWKLNFINTYSYCYFWGREDHISGAYNSVKCGSSLVNFIASCDSSGVLNPLYAVYTECLRFKLWASKYFDNETLGFFDGNCCTYYSLSDIYDDLSKLLSYYNNRAAYDKYFVFLQSSNAVDLVYSAMQFMPSFNLSLANNRVRADVVIGNLLVNCRTYNRENEKLMMFLKCKFRGLLRLTYTRNVNVNYSFEATTMSNCALFGLGFKRRVLRGGDALLKYSVMTNYLMPYWHKLAFHDLAMHNLNVFATTKYYLGTNWRLRVIGGFYYLFPTVLAAADRRELNVITVHGNCVLNNYSYLLNPALMFDLFVKHGNGNIHNRWTQQMTNNLFSNICALVTYDHRLLKVSYSYFSCLLRAEMGAVLSYHTYDAMLNGIVTGALHCKLFNTFVVKITFNLDRLLNLNRIKSSVFSFSLGI